MQRHHARAALTVVMCTELLVPGHAAAAVAAAHAALTPRGLLARAGTVLHVSRGLRGPATRPLPPRRPPICRAPAARASHPLSPPLPPLTSTHQPISILTTTSSPSLGGAPSSPTRFSPTCPPAAVLRPLFWCCIVWVLHM
eukprot:7377250-Prymnesium_polylepis.2